MTGRLLWASLTRRFRQLALIFVAVAVAAATVTTMADFSLHARQALTRGLAAFGPNLSVRPEVGAPPLISESTLAAVANVAGVARAAGVGEGSVTLPPTARNGKPGSPAPDEGAGAAGTHFTVVAMTREWPLLHSTWKLEGKWPESGEVVLGSAVSRRKARTALAARGVTASGRVVTGNRLDHAIIAPWADHGVWGLPAGFQRIEVRTTAALAASRGAVERIAAAIERRVPGIDAQPLLKVSKSDAELSSRVTLLLVVVSLVTLLLSGLAVMTATSALVGERRSEFALWFALGARGRRVGRVLALELLSASLLAAVGGALVGLAIGVRLSRQFLDVSAAFSWSTVGVALISAAGVAALVVAAAMSVALRRIRRLEPAVILAGE